MLIKTSLIRIWIYPKSRKSSTATSLEGNITAEENYMSVPKKHTTWGTLSYRGEKYGVLSGYLNQEIHDKINRYIKNGGEWFYTSAPWMRKIQWRIDDGKLYLTELYSREFHRTIFGNDEPILADWIDEMKLLASHRRICRTHERSGAYLHKMHTLILFFERGVLFDTKKGTELYTSVDLTDYIERTERYSTLRIDKVDLLDYLDLIRPDEYPFSLDNLTKMHNTAQREKISAEEDLLFPVFKSFIDSITDDIVISERPVTIKDIDEILRSCDIGLFAKVQGDNLHKLLQSLAASITDDGIIKAKGCVVRVVVADRYYRERVKSGLERFFHLIGKEEMPRHFSVSEEPKATKEFTIEVMATI